MRQRPNLNSFCTILALWALIALAMGQCPSGTTGYQCSPCPNYCDNCDTNASICSACTFNYYLDDNGTCQNCPINCLNCSTPYVCDQCKPGYDTAYNDQEYQQCVFYWWKWFLIIFGTLLGVALLILLIFFIRKKLKDQDTNNTQIQYEMKMENTQANVQ